MVQRCDVCGKATDKLIAIGTKFEWDSLYRRSVTVESMNFCEDCNNRSRREMEIRNLLREFYVEAYDDGDMARKLPDDIKFLELAHKIYNIATERGTDMMSIRQLQIELRKAKLSEWNEQLKPCPFCGRKAFLAGTMRYPKDRNESVLGISAVCLNTDCIIYNADDKYYLTEKEAVNKWNERGAVGAQGEE